MEVTVRLAVADYKKVPGRIRSQIKQVVCDNRSVLLDHWNRQTNGLRFDIDAILGQSDCSGLT